MLLHSGSECRGDDLESVLVLLIHQAGGGAGAGVSMPHVPQERGALAFQLDVCRMVINQLGFI
jgi:hypothetical protein